MTATLLARATADTVTPYYAYVADAQGVASHAGSSTLSETPQLVPGAVLFVPSSQAYFWSREWQDAEMAADADIAAGRVERFATADDAIAALRSEEAVAA